MPSLEGKTVAVTGGAGLIGQWVVHHLLVAGARPVVIDDFSKGDRSAADRWDKRVRVTEGNLENADFAGSALLGHDIVIHLASRAYGIGHSSNSHMLMLQHNERITDNLISALALSPPAYLLIASSSCVYSDQNLDHPDGVGLFDGEPEHANRGYGWAKRFLEQKVSLLAEMYTIPLGIVRPFNIYGETYRWVGPMSQAIPMLVDKVMRSDDTVNVWGPGPQRRTYVHASDCARIIVAMCEKSAEGRPVDIGHQETVSAVELVELIAAKAGKAVTIQTQPDKPMGAPHKSCSTASLEEAIGPFTFDISFEEGIERMIQWHKQRF